VLQQQLLQFYTCFGCQVWATSSLTSDSSKITPTRVLHLGFLKRLLGVKKSTACSAKQVRCPFFSTGSDASYESGTVYSLQTSYPFLRKLRKMCELTFLLQIEVTLDLSGSARNPRFPCISAIFECHTISRIYPSKTVRAYFARTYHRELERA
jgi:hypothetical protein